MRKRGVQQLGHSRTHKKGENLTWISEKSKSVDTDHMIKVRPPKCHVT
jgi:hypothetical protein